MTCIPHSKYWLVVVYCCVWKRQGNCYLWLSCNSSCYRVQLHSQVKAREREIKGGHSAWKPKKRSTPISGVVTTIKRFLTKVLWPYPNLFTRSREETKDWKLPKPIILCQATIKYTHQCASGGTDESGYYMRTGGSTNIRCPHRYSCDITTHSCLRSALEPLRSRCTIFDIISLSKKW